MKAMTYRMVEMQVMNLVNMGVKNNISFDAVQKLGLATIDATQLFLSDYEVETLRLQLENRMTTNYKEKAVI